LCHHWRLFDNTGEQPHLVAEEKDGRLTVDDAPRLALIERPAKVQIVPDSATPAVEEPFAFTPEEETRRAMRAMRKAFADAVLENLRFGLPVIQWRDGSIVERRSTAALFGMSHDWEGIDGPITGREPTPPTTGPSLGAPTRSPGLRRKSPGP